MSDSIDINATYTWMLLEFLATWGLQATILLVVGLLFSLWVRKPANQATVYRVSLVAVLACPVLAQSLACTGMPMWSLDLRPRMTSNFDPRPAASVARSESQPLRDLSDTPETPSTIVGDSPIDQQFFESQEASSLPTIPPESSFAALENMATSDQVVNLTDVKPSLIFELSILCAWIVVALAFAIHLLIDVYRARCLIQQSANAEAQSIALCHSLADKLNTPRPRVLINLWLSSPCLIGQWRPAILLPEGTSPSQQTQIFLHELAHLQRGDWMWAVIGRIACALLWFHPLVWWSHRLNLSVAEDICDDYVIQHDGNREDYLRQLIEIAERSLPQAVPAAVSMVGFHSKLGKRAVRIMDTARSLSVRVSRRFMIATGLVALATVVSAALLEIGHSEVVASVNGNDTDSNAALGDQANSKEGDTDDAKERANDVKEKRPENLSRTYSGKVIGPDGKPIAGATVAAVNTKFRGSQAQVVTLASAQSASDGAYSLTFQSAEGSKVIAIAEGFGQDIVDFETLTAPYEKGESQLDLHLLNQNLITGRVVDTEGNAVAGIKVQVLHLTLPQSDQAVAQWSAKSNSDLFKGRSYQMSRDPRVTETLFPSRATRSYDASLAPTCETDQTGAFRLEGIGDNCLVHVRLTGNSIALHETQLVARDMQPIHAYSHWIRTEDFRHYGNRSNLVVSPSQRIVGRITEAGTDKAIPNLKVNLKRMGKHAWLLDDTIESFTDDDGRYELHGASMGGGHIVEVAIPADQPFFAISKELESTNETAPLVCNFDLRRTKWIRGRVTDDKGHPLAAKLNFHPYRDNEFAPQFPNFDPQISGKAPGNDQRSNANGEFRAKAIPGRGVLTAFAADQQMGPLYIPNRPEGLLERIGGDLMTKVFNGFSADLFDAMVEVEIDPGQDEIVQDLVFKVGHERQLKLTNIQGEPLTKINILGRTWSRNLENNVSLEAGSLTLAGLATHEKRLVVLVTDDGHYGKNLLVNGDQSISLDVSLERCSLIRGRVVDSESKPVQNVGIEVTVQNEASPDSWRRELSSLSTNDRGEFEARVPPGGHYSIAAYSALGPNFHVKVRPLAGDDYDLGDLTDGVKQDQTDLKKLKSKESAASSTATIRGVVQFADGTSAQNADVAVIANRKSGQMFVGTDVLAQGTTNVAGNFELIIAKATTKTHANAQVIVRAKDSAIQWRKLDLDVPQQDIGTLILQPHQLIQVRLLDLEGQPAQHVLLDVQTVIQRKNGTGTQDGAGYHDLLQPPAAWIGPLKSDNDGLLTIEGVPADHGVSLKVHGSDRFATQSMALNTGRAETRAANDATYRDIVKNLKPGEIGVIPLAPAHIFEGTVRLGKNGPPAIGAKVTVWASQQQLLGSMISVEGRTDSSGHYRIIPYPGVRYGVQAYPPEGQPYQISAVNDLKWNESQPTRVVDIDLTRGLVATGQIVDAASGQPVIDASVQYWPMDTNPNAREGIVSGWQGIQRTNEQGNFVIPVLSGDGWLIVHAIDSEYLIHQESGNNLSAGRKGGQRVYAHAFVKLSPTEDHEPNALRIELEKAQQVTVEVFDPDGKPVDDAIVLSRLMLSETTPDKWRGMHAHHVRKGKVTLRGFSLDQEVPIHILDPRRQLGATLVINAKTKMARANLEPCGSAEIYLTDQEGKPAAGLRTTVMMMVTPGPSFAGNEVDRSLLFADEDFVENIDRLNHAKNLSDSSGKVTISALIPGATYRYFDSQRKTHDFVAKSGETIRLEK